MIFQSFPTIFPWVSHIQGCRCARTSSTSTPCSQRGCPGARLWRWWWRCFWSRWDGWEMMGNSWENMMKSQENERIPCFFCRDICRRVGFIVGFRNEKWWLKQQTWWNNGDSLERLTTMLADLSVHNQTWPGNPRTSGNLNGKVVEVIGYFPANHAWLPEGNKWKQVFDVTWMGMWWDFTVPTILENRMICAILEDDHQSMNTQIICPCSGWTPEDRKWVSSPQW